MGERVVAVSAIFGGYDRLRPVPDPPARVAEWRCYTDDAGAVDVPPWTVHIIGVHPPARDEHPRLAAKRWKTALPTDCDWSIWVDGCLEWVNAAGLVDAISRTLAEHDVAAFRHPRRNNIFAEAAASLTEAPEKYQGLDLHGQVAHYAATFGDRLDGLGLWATTVLGFRNTTAVQRACAEWMAHCELLTYPDQLSFPVVMADHGVSVGAIDGPLIGNGWFRWAGHPGQVRVDMERTAALATARKKRRRAISNPGHAKKRSA
jgi:hypothetical protein